MGASLFSRHSGGARLTVAGELFLTRAQNALDQIEIAQRDVGTIGRGERGSLRVGIFASLASTFVSDVLQAYDAKHPGVTLDFLERQPSELIPAIRQRQLDIAFLTGMPDADGCDVAHLWNERLYVVMSEGDELAAQQEIGWEDLRDRQFVVTEVPPGPKIRDYLSKRFAQIGATPLVKTHAVYRDSLMQIVATGGSLTLVNEAIAAIGFAGVVYRSLAGEVVPLCAVWSPSNENPAFRRLLSLAKTFSKKCGVCLAKNDCNETTKL